MEDSVPHRIEYTRNRHSRAVYADGTIVIRLARNLSTTEERRHVENLLRRMTKHVAKEHARTPIDPFRPLLEGASSHLVTPSIGPSCLFELIPGTRTRTKKTESGWKVTVGPKLRRAQLHSFLWKLLSAHAARAMENTVREANEDTLQVPIHSVRLRFMKSQWGSCSRLGVITLNASLLFVPRDLLRYVIIHELAHRRVQNHSRRFWSLVESVLPECNDQRSALRNFRMSSL